MTLRLLCLWLLAAHWLAAGPVAAQRPVPDKVYTEFGGVTKPELPGPDGTPEDPQVAVQRLLPPLQLPPAPPGDDYQRVFVRFVVEKNGTVSSLRVTQPVSEAVDAAVLAAVRRLPRFRPGRRAGQPVRVMLAVGIWPGGVPAMAATPPLPADQRPDTLEARTLRQGTVEFIPGDPTALLWRALPLSFPRASQLITHAWHPSSYGPQLFFSAPGPGSQQYECLLFILDPIGPTTYAVRALNLGSQGDLTDVAALFFADADHDGRRDLLALTQCSLRDQFQVNGQWVTGRQTHYQTTAIYFRGLDRAGRPRYQQQYLANLDGAASAAEARRLLAAPAKRAATPAAKAAKAAKR